MRQSVSSGLTVAIALLAATAGPLASPGEAAQSPPAAYESAATCGQCHETIHLYWKDSAHARAATAPSYVASLQAAATGAPDGNAVQRECNSCHAPTTLVTGDFRLETPLSKEGVTCDFCHTVEAVDMSDTGHPFRLDPGPIKRGPLEYATSEFHQTAYSPLHRSSPLLCAGCHEWTNAQGVNVLSNWSEWRESEYATNGMICQECHMPQVPGESVGEGLTATRRVVNLHRMQGGSVATKLRSGLGLEIRMLGASSGSAQVEVVVRNQGVGHAVPGGLGSNHLVLVVGVDTGAGALANPQQRVYKRELRDARGRTLVAPHEMFLEAASVGEDSRIGPKQARTERFTLPVAEGWRAIVARLEFRDAATPDAQPMLIMEQRHPR